MYVFGEKFGHFFTTKPNVGMTSSWSN